MTHEELERITEGYNGLWAVNHARRLMRLVELLSEGAAYDREVIAVAAYIHDWGAYPHWAVAGMEHHLRSVEVAGPFLEEHGYAEEFRARVLECIANHHGGRADRSMESILFTDADALDLLGVVGTLRVFSMLPKDLRGAVEKAQYYRDLSMAAIQLPAAKRMAEIRVRETNELLARFREESFGLF